MAEIINESVCVATEIKKTAVVPAYMVWRRKIYTFGECSMHYCISEGNICCHIFYMVCKEACMQIALNTKTLRWMLQSIEPI